MLHPTKVKIKGSPKVGFGEKRMIGKTHLCEAMGPKLYGHFW